MRFTFICAAIGVGLVSCKEKDLNLYSYWQCNQAQKLDTTAIAKKLEGSWLWTKQDCALLGKFKYADKKIRVTFRSNRTFSVTENSTTLTQGNWKIKQEDGNSWGLAMSSPSTYLYGRILFCDNQVVFNQSYIDGCDNVFKKE